MSFALVFSVNAWDDAHNIGMSVSSCGSGGSPQNNNNDFPCHFFVSYPTLLIDYYLRHKQITGNICIEVTRGGKFPSVIPVLQLQTIFVSEWLNRARYYYQGTKTARASCDMKPKAPVTWARKQPHRPCVEEILWAASS